MRRLFALLIAYRLYGQEFVFVPDYEPYVETLFPKGEVTNFSEASLWGKVKYLLQREGHTVSTSNLKEVPHKQNKIQSWLRKEKKNGVTFVIWNVPRHVSKETLRKIGDQHLALIVFEPATVDPYLHTKEYYSLFSKVMTWEDDLIDGKKFYKYRYPVAYPMRNDIEPFAKRKLCCIMAANKTSKTPGEIYTERKQAISYLNQYPQDFDLYGPAWEREGFVSYKGMVEDKRGTLKQYKFSLCYENTKGVRGYITEKIFDCLESGTVPVYLGAPNIADEVPSDCFIDKGNFSSYEELYHYMKSMPEEEFNGYLVRMRAFLQSEKAKRYSRDAFAIAIVNGLTGRNLTLEDVPH